MGDDSFKLITWKDHTEELIKLVSKAKDYIEIVSPWIMGSTYWCFFNNISDNIKLSVIFRWPTENDDEKFYDLELLETLFHKGNVDVQWVGTSHPLHAKVYHVKDIGAIVTSANMTDKGFSTKDNTFGNIEVGAVIHNAKHLENIEELLETLPVHTLTESELQQLKDWKNKQKKWKKDNTEVLSNKIPIEEPKRSEDNPIAQALKIAGKDSLFKKYTHKPKGYGRKAYSLFLNSSKKNYIVRALISESHKKPLSGMIKSYHFDISKKDIIRWKQKNKKRVYGLILVPVVKNSEGIKEYNKESAPIAFIPFSDLFSRNNFAITPFLHGYKKYKYLQLHLAQKADNEWVLKNAGKYKKEISAEPYLNTTSKMKNSHINL